MSEVIYNPRERFKGYEYNYYSEGWYEGACPDAFGSAPTKDGLLAHIKTVYPDAKIMRGIIGTCCECGEEHFDWEIECENCGEEVT